jgi:proline dehydrogenase
LGGKKLAGLVNDLLFRIAKHWIAGETYEEALARAEQSYPHKIRAIVNLLGEDVKSREETNTATATYVEILNAINAKQAESCISIKPTQLGLSIDRSLYAENMMKILSLAKSFGNFVWIDMEGSEYTEATVDSYLEFRRQFGNVGVAIQAYLKRSEDDVGKILDAKGIIRLCKGAYNESPDLVYKARDKIRENYSKLMRIMFERGIEFAVATHDEKLIKEAIALSNEHGKNFEFQMLMGIRDAKKLELAESSYRVSQYIPFGKSWWGYSVRRIREHKSNIFLLARSLVSS